ncbi:MAG: hypothetical protein MUE85_01890 [Microscillaceae bacterium]|jgi:hypothetical protein|nr:hypothetical protein [Microscillaceae bacterium]
MKLIDVKDKIDAYFDKVSVQEIITQFEELGYEFEDLNDDYILHVSKVELYFQEKPLSVVEGYVDYQTNKTDIFISLTPLLIAPNADFGNVHENLISYGA